MFFVKKEMLRTFNDEFLSIISNIPSRTIVHETDKAQKSITAQRRYDVTVGDGLLFLFF